MLYYYNNDIYQGRTRRADLPRGVGQSTEIFFAAAARFSLPGSGAWGESVDPARRRDY